MTNPLSQVAPEQPEKQDYRFSILVVDDESNIRQMTQELLELEGYEVHSAADGLEGADTLRLAPPNLIISDYAMPGMNGLDLLEFARYKAPDTARILYTGYADVELALAAINRGAVDRIVTKPFDPADLLTTVRDCLEQVRLRKENERLLIITQTQNKKLASWNQALEKEVTARTGHIKRITEASVYSLANLAESRAQDIGGHLRRMQEFARVIAESLMISKNPPAHLTEGYIQDLHISTLLHDVGKVGIPDGILFKPGRLSDEEFSVMKTHARIGEETLRKAQAYIGDESFLVLGIVIAGHHHERWDGKGYPDGLKGEDIPLAARIVSIADVYDALTSPRVYKKAWSHGETIEYMVKNGGTQFDPVLIEVLRDVSDRFQEIRTSWD